MHIGITPGILSMHRENHHFTMHLSSDWVLVSSKGVGGGFGYLRFHIRQTEAIINSFHKDNVNASRSKAEPHVGLVQRCNDQQQTMLFGSLSFESDVHECMGRIVFASAQEHAQISGFVSIMAALL